MDMILRILCILVRVHRRMPLISSSPVPFPRRAFQVSSCRRPLDRPAFSGGRRPSILARPQTGQIHFRLLWWVTGERRIFTRQRGQCMASAPANV
jgi:hypothetical protein